MTELHILVLALIQGITEFLPISSSGHLVLLPYFTGWPDQGLLMDVAVHIGTLGAVMLYFWRDLWLITRGFFRTLKGKKDPHFKTGVLLIFATIPVLVAGYYLNSLGDGLLRSTEIIAWTTLGFGILLYVADKVGLTIRRIEHSSYGDALFIGLAQCLALIPGTSRSGITITAARFLGFERPDAARFSMLLSLPTILGAGVLKGYDLYQSGNMIVTHQAIQAAGLAFGAAFIALFLMMAWLKKASFTPFVLYRIALGGILLYYVYA